MTRRMRRTLALVTWLAVCSATSVASQSPQSPPWKQVVQDSARAALAQSNTPGLWVVVVDRGQVVISEALGVASTIGPTPLTRETVVRMAGPGELSIGLALLRLADVGKIDLDAPIGQYVRVPSALGRVTARQLITARAGLRAKHFSHPLWQDSDLARNVQSWDASVFIAEPGETQSHSHYGIALAGYVVESVVGKPFPDAMREVVWEPMGISTGTTRIRDLLTMPMAQGHRVQNGVADVLRPLGLGFIGWPNGPFLSLDGLERFAVALAEPVNGGRVRDGGRQLPSWSSAGAGRGCRSGPSSMSSAGSARWLPTMAGAQPRSSRA